MSTQPRVPRPKFFPSRVSDFDIAECPSLTCFAGESMLEVHFEGTRLRCSVRGWERETAIELVRRMYEGQTGMLQRSCIEAGTETAFFDSGQGRGRVPNANALEVQIEGINKAEDPRTIDTNKDSGTIEATENIASHRRTIAARK